MTVASMICLCTRCVRKSSLSPASQICGGCLPSQCPFGTSSQSGLNRQNYINIRRCLPTQTYRSTGGFRSYRKAAQQDQRQVRNRVSRQSESRELQNGQGENAVRIPSNEMEKSLKNWIYRGDAESTNRCFELLETLRSNRNTPSTNFSRTIGTNMLNQIINNWRKLVKQDAKNGRVSTGNQSQHKNNLKGRLLLPTEVVERVELYWRELSIPPDVRTYTMVMDASNSYVDDEGQGILFAENLLNRLIDDFNHFASPTSRGQPTTSSGLLAIQPDIFTFGSVIHGWSKSRRMDAPQRAHAWLDRIKALQKQGDSWANNVQLNAVLYTSVIMAYANAGDAHIAEQILEELLVEYQRHIQDTIRTNNAVAKNLKPDLYTFNAVMSAWSRNAGGTRQTLSEQVRQPRYYAAERVEALLSRIKELHELGYIDKGPNLISYNILIDCWSKSTGGWQSQNEHKNEKNGKKAQERALDIFRFLQNNSDPSLRPDDRSYNMVIAAFSRAGDVAKAEALLREMMAEYQSGRDHVKPDVRTFTSVLLAYSRWARNVATARSAISNPSQRVQTLVGIAERAEALLRQMQQLLQTGRFDVRPNARSFSSVIDCWAQASLPLHIDTNKYDGSHDEKMEMAGSFAAEKAEALLREMQQQKDPTVLPDAGMYAGVMNAWARAGKPIRVSKLLDELLESPGDDGKIAENHFAKPNNHFVKPNVQMFTTVLAAWANCTSPLAATRAEEVLTKMEKLYETGKLPLCKPNVVSYTAVIRCFANLAAPNRQDAADRAQSILEFMKHSDDAELQPNARTYAEVIRAHSNAGRPEMAEQCLNEMLHEYQTHGKTEVRPDVYTFNFVLTAWSKSNSIEAPQRAEAILAEMQNLHASGVLSSGPNAFCFGSVLSCWQKSKQSGAAERAESILRSMKQNGDVKPNLILYNTVIDAYSNTAAAASASRNTKEIRKDGGLMRDEDSVDPRDAVEVATKEEKVQRAVHRALVLFNELIGCVEGENIQRSDEETSVVRNGYRTSSERHELTPDKYTYHSIVRAISCVRDGDVSQKMMETVLTAMRRHKVTPNAPTRKLLKSFAEKFSN